MTAWAETDRVRCHAARKNIAALAERIRAAIDWHRTDGRGTLRIELDAEAGSRPSLRRGEPPAVVLVRDPDDGGGHPVALTGVTFELEERVSIRLLRAVYEAGGTVRSLSSDDRNGLCVVVDIDGPPARHLPDGWEVIP